MEIINTQRELCRRCRQPRFGCFCEHIQCFDPQLKFVILIHPIEVRRRIATGRMAHLCLKESELIEGQDYTHDKKLNTLLADDRYSPIVLYPGAQSFDISRASHDEKRALFPNGKIPMILVIDGTWCTARKMIHQSKNIQSLPRFCFTPDKPSRFRVRKQPREHCYSTIEAIHHTLELLSPALGTPTGQHDALLSVFDVMVEKQIQLVQQAFDNPRPNSYRRLKTRLV
ncbi:MAG: DTW domain-containing protein [Bdellovibrionales bacterium]|nr:DTW domain-containing protein [Bdellovibrionales bacterium]